MSEYDHETSTMRRPWPTGGLFAMVEKKKLLWLNWANDNVTLHEDEFVGFLYAVSFALNYMLFKIFSPLCLRCDKKKKNGIMS